MTKIVKFNNHDKLNKLYEQFDGENDINVILENIENVKKDIVSAVETQNDVNLLNRLLAVLSEKTIEYALKFLNKKRKGSFNKQDLEELLNMVQRSNTSFRDKLNLIYKSANKGTFNLLGLIAASRRAVVKFENYIDKSNETLKDILPKLMKWKPNLGSQSAVGSGEGLTIFLASDTAKGKKGDIELRSFGDLELKGNAARWHSARGKYTQMKDAFKKFHELFIAIAPSAEKDRVKASRIYTANVKGLNNIADICAKDNVTKDQIGNAFAEAMKVPFNANDAQVKKLRDADWYSNGKIDSIKWRAAYAYTIFETYSKIDGFSAIIILDDKKLTAYTVASGDDVYHGTIAGKIKVTFPNFNGGTDSRSVSPNFTVGV